MIHFTSLIQSVGLTPALSAYPFTSVLVLLFIGGLVQQHMLNPEQIARETMGFSTLFASQVGGVDLPAWAFEGPFLFLIALGVIYEWSSERSATAQEMMGFVNRMVKTFAGFSVQYGMVNSQMEEILNLLAQTLPPDALALLSGGVAVATVAPMAVQPAEALAWLAQPIAIIWSTIASVAIWIISGIRAAIIGLISLMDPGGHLGLLRLFSLGDGGWAITTTIVLIFFPLLALLLAGITVLSLWLIRRYFEARERKQLIACASCGSQMHPSALECPSCRQLNQQPRMVGMFGQPRPEPVTDPAAHRIALIKNRRCPSCATRLKKRDIQQACPACATVTFADIAQVNTFIRTLDRQLPRALLISGLLGLVPVIGVVPAIIYYRLSLISSLQSYVPVGIGCFTNWGLRFVAIFLIALQSAPGIGIFAIPALCLINYTVYRQIIYGQATNKIRRAETVVPDGSTVSS
ncbi:hypothetical protein [Chloroflexus sp.]|uniref:hypothetical protein n=1 Tax=Chloroflexus sp. TaxID=1904827 RepID=UPI002628956E|nr:hypothetical protein [uncultured Chloroflexus sp.]